MTKEKRIEGYKEAVELLTKLASRKTPVYIGLCYALTYSFKSLDAYENMEVDFPDIYKHKSELKNTIGPAYWFPLNEIGLAIRIKILEIEIKNLESELI